MSALHEAFHTLERQESQMAIVCGANLILNPDMFIPSSELGFLSPSGRCKSFDVEGDGYGRGEGVVALLLKPLASAIADRDAVRAVIKGVTLNQDGRTQGITMPSTQAQKQNMVKLYSNYSLNPADIQYIEAHVCCLLWFRVLLTLGQGTGTSAGDPLEFSAIQDTLACIPRRHPLVVGSVKSNIGHLEACAALAAIIKTVECLERARIPPQMHFENPNPKIDFDNVRIPTSVIPWPSSSGKSRRAAVNTFGAGGTNGHAVLEAYPRHLSRPDAHKRVMLFKISAIDERTLERLSLKYAQHVEAERPSLPDLAYTMLSRRSTLRQSCFITANTLDTLAEKLKAKPSNIVVKASGHVKNTVFVFTGQGAQCELVILSEQLSSS